MRTLLLSIIKYIYHNPYFSIKHIDKENKSIEEVNINIAGNTTEHKEIHLPLLEEDVFSDMHNALVS